MLLTGAALGDCFGRWRMFVIGILIFSVALAEAALSTSVDALIAARAATGPFQPQAAIGALAGGPACVSDTDWVPSSGSMMSC